MAAGDIGIHNHPYGVRGFGIQLKSNDVYRASPNDVGLRPNYKYFITVGKVGTVTGEIADEFRRSGNDIREEGIRIQTPTDEMKFSTTELSRMVSEDKGKLFRQYTKSKEKNAGNAH
jgi:hypothetical protein